MNKNIQVLEDNDWISECVGPWSSLLILAAKSRQEECTNVKDVVWVSYRSICGFTVSFEFPILRWTNSVEDFGDSSRHIFFILLDARSRYH